MAETKKSQLKNKKEKVDKRALTQKRKITKNKFLKLRKAAEEIVSRGNVTPKINLRDINIINQLLHELEVYQVELEIQNDQLNEVQKELDNSLREYQKLYDNAPVGYIECDKRGMIIKVNQMAVQLLSKPREKLVNSYLLLHIPKHYHQQFTGYLKKVHLSSRALQVDIEFEKRNDLPVWLRFTTAVEKDKVQTVIKFNIVLEDISELKEAEALRNDYEHTLEAEIQKRVKELKEKNSALMKEMKQRAKVENELKVSELRYKSIFENSHDGIVVVDDSGIIRDINKAGLEIFEYTLSEMMNQPYSILEIQDTIKGIDKKIKKLRKSGSDEGEVVFLSKNGATKTLQYRTIAGFLPGLHMSIFTDITERKKAEQALKQSEAQLRATLYSIGDALISTDINGKILYMNRVAEKLLGWREKQAIGKTLNEIFILYHESDGTQKDHPLLNAFAGESTIISDGYMLYSKKFLTRIPVSGVSAPVKDDSGKISGAVLVLRDMTEIRQRELELKQSEEKFFKAFHTSPDAVLINRFFDGLYIDVNSGFNAVFGFAAEEVFGMTWEEINIWGDEVAYQNFINKIKENRSIANFETEFLRKNGQILTGLISATLIEINNEECILSIIRDISQRKQYEREILESRFILTEAQKLAQSGTWVMEAEHAGMSWSVELCRLFNAENISDNVSINYFLSFVHEQDKFMMEEWFSKLRQGLNPGEHLFRISDNSGGLRYIRGTAGNLSLPGSTEFRYVGIEQDVTEREQAKKHIELALKEKELLLKEIYHRVKNNFQLIISLLSLQEAKLEGSSTREVLIQSQNRIRSMSIIHELMYKTGNLKEMSIKHYFEELMGFLVNSYSDSHTHIHLNLEFVDEILPVEILIPCGLMLNELFTNTMKYAFDQEENNNIAISLRYHSENELCLRYSDNGKGLPEGFDLSKLNSIGMNLIRLMAKQLSGTLEILKPERGVEFVITLKFKE